MKARGGLFGCDGGRGNLAANAISSSEMGSSEANEGLPGCESGSGQSAVEASSSNGVDPSCCGHFDGMMLRDWLGSKLRAALKKPF